jgi:hypothetical protein
MTVTRRYTGRTAWDHEAFRRDLAIELAQCESDDRDMAITSVHRFSHLVSTVTQLFPGAVYDANVDQFLRTLRSMIAEVVRVYTHDNNLQIRAAMDAHLARVDEIVASTTESTLILNGAEVQVPPHYSYFFGTQQLRNGVPLHAVTISTDLVTRDIIKTCYPRGIYSSQYSEVYTKTQYYQVNKSYIEYIRISLNADRPLNFNSGPVLLKIHLKQRR